MGLPSLESIPLTLDSHLTFLDSVEVVRVVQEKLIAEDIPLSEGTKLYYSDRIHGHVIATVVDGELVSTRQAGSFSIPIEDLGSTWITVTLDILDYSLITPRYDHEQDELETSLGDNPWKRVTIADFMELLEQCSALETPTSQLTVRDVATGVSNVMLLLVTLGESLGSSLAAYYAIADRLRKAAANIGCDNPLKNISIPTPERFLLWGDCARMWLRSGTAVRELYLDRPWPGWIRLSRMLAYF